MVLDVFVGFIAQLQLTAQSPMQRKLLIVATVCAVAWCQDQATQFFESKAIPAKLNISCRVNEATRTVAVTIVNRTEERCYFQRSGPLTDYQAVVTTAAGKRLPQLTPEQGAKQLNPSGEFGNIALSTTLVALGPREAYTGSFPLSVHVAVPRQGGRFQILVGQVLFSLNDTGFQPDPQKTVWCEPMNVTFPPLPRESPYRN